jgi:uncharacterized membrane protein (UPF0127 family)
MKWARLVPIGIALVTTAFFAAASSAPKFYPLKVATDEGEVVFKVELAQTPEEQKKGLMDRTYMAKNRGMLFVYKEAQPVTFWMKNMLIPIDMIFIGADHRIKRILPVVPPCPFGQECPLYSPAEPVQYVLEIRAGIAEAEKLEVGDNVITPF